MDLFSWRQENLQDRDGIVVGADITQEWLLPWWWKHYSQWNDHPVAFADFGMSFEKKEWCQERGELVPLRIFDDWIKEKEEIDKTMAKEWEEDTGKHFWECRKAWFKKPLACLQSPFKRTLWIDLDCEIRGSLAPLFAYAENPFGLSLAKDNLWGSMYNSGVIAFLRNTLLIKEWAESALEANGRFRGDQELLSAMLQEKQIELPEIPASYNWSRTREENPNAIIQHWHGVHGKTVIRHAISQAN